MPSLGLQKVLRVLAPPNPPRSIGKSPLKGGLPGGKSRSTLATSQSPNHVSASPAPSPVESASTVPQGIPCLSCPSLPQLSPEPGHGLS